jgi:ariadne-1
LANTKPAQQVSRIEKNQGCKHMTCQRCKFEFCWIWVTGTITAPIPGATKCNKYDTSSTVPRIRRPVGCGQGQARFGPLLALLQTLLRPSRGTDVCQAIAERDGSAMVLLQESVDDAKVGCESQDGQ